MLQHFFYFFDYLCLSVNYQKTSHLKNSQLLKNINIIFGAVSFSGYGNNSFGIFFVVECKKIHFKFQLHSFISSYNILILD